MLDKIFDNPDLENYMFSFEEGQIIFMEGDENQDLFILISGQLDVLKGNNRIAEITRPGDPFGEMSFLIGARRTATVRARSEGKAIRIPKKEITAFLERFPETASYITRLLASRLDETSQVMFGLKEFCDKLPDAVFLTNREGKVLTWNAVAEDMYGRTWARMHHRPVEEIYEEPEEYKSYLEEAQSGYSMKEKVLRIRHPEKGIRYISTSTTVLYDGHHNFQGILSLGRDVTKFREMEKKYRKFRNRIIPSFLLLCLIAAALFLFYPRISKEPTYIESERKQEFRNQLGKDFLLLESLLRDPLSSRDRSKTCQVMKAFFDIQGTELMPYRGLVILNDNLTVFDAYSIQAQEETDMIGTSYAGIEFKGNEGSLHRVLTLYRVDKDHPMGKKGIEVAFEMKKDNHFMGWLLFQMDVDLLKARYDMTEKELEGFRFNRP